MFANPADACDYRSTEAGPRTGNCVAQSPMGQGESERKKDLIDMWVSEKMVKFSELAAPSLFLNSIIKICRRTKHSTTTDGFGTALEALLVPQDSGRVPQIIVAHYQC
ncbi:hypothetical protein AVEN_46831-1 [Araneus ventricosus]|uniref:Uncharacterized protein n=1 Tax=Araneus ventricosus TaxID=182803 RepID=A0A4Y2M8Y9_ARAVE|nr:hypothetical protein AVEN_46831-1 [Araneus ventricosus]